MAKISMIEIATNEYSISLPIIEIPVEIADSEINKGSYRISSDVLEIGEQLLIKFVNGNTSSAPAITINGTACIILGNSPCLPTNIDIDNIVEVTYGGNNQLIITKLFK